MKVNGHSRRYYNTGYDQFQGPSTLKCIGSISQRYAPNHPTDINPNSDSRSRIDDHSRRYCNTGLTSLKDRDQDHFKITRSVQVYVCVIQYLKIFCNPTKSEYGTDLEGDIACKVRHDETKLLQILGLRDDRREQRVEVNYVFYFTLMT